MATEDEALRGRCLAARLAAARTRMAAEGVDVLIAYGAGTHSLLSMNPGWYFSGFKQMGPHIAAILPLEGEPLLVVTPRWDASRARERSAIQDIVAVEPEDFLSGVGDALRQRGWLGRRFGVAGGLAQPRSIREGWEGVLGAVPANAEKLASDLAKIRDEWSLTCTKRAIDVAERGYARLLETATTGVPEYKLASELEIYMRELGADDNFQLMSASRHNRAVHFPTDRMLEHGDVLLAEITPSVEGEYMQICRTAVFGGPNELQQEKFALLDTALRAGMKAAKPGTPVGDVVMALNAPIEAAGYGKYTKPPYMRTRGHSMALGAMEPELMIGQSHVLEAGMAFVMHPNQYIPETGYFMCGEPVVITESGAQALTSEMGTLGSIV